MKIFAQPAGDINVDNYLETKHTVTSKSGKTYEYWGDKTGAIYYQEIDKNIPVGEPIPIIVKSPQEEKEESKNNLNELQLNPVFNVDYSSTAIVVGGIALMLLIMYLTGGMVILPV